MAMDRFQGVAAESRIPTIGKSIWFRFKVLANQIRRLILDLVRPTPMLRKGNADHRWLIAASSSSPLWVESDKVEGSLERGKVHNLRIAARHLNRTLIPAGSTFSFWRQLGPATRIRRFVRGRQLQEGCLVPAIGGGLCQLSNALYQVALEAGCEIVERHTHTRIVPGSSAQAGRDATIAWNHIDLRFRPSISMQLCVRLDRDQLIVDLKADSVKQQTSSPIVRPRTSQLKVANSCATCGETTCHKHAPTQRIVLSAQTAWILDVATPELANWVKENADQGDIALTPLASKRYGWNLESFGQVRSQPFWAAIRGWKSRSLARQGPQRRKFELEMSDRFARQFSRSLTPEVSNLVIDVKFLGHLWRSGELGGRTFSVLMTRWPIHLIQERLDLAAKAFPDQPTLSDFRADELLLEAERDGLAAAQLVISPHGLVVRLFGDRAIQIRFRELPTLSTELGPAIAFPGPTIARKGAFLVRQLAADLSLEVVLLGSELEGPDFWNGINTRRPSGEDNWLQGVGVVVSPGFVDERPERLIQAIASGVPVVATDACGLPEHPLLSIVSCYDPEELRDVVSRLLHR